MTLAKMLTMSVGVTLSLAGCCHTLFMSGGVESTVVLNRYRLSYPDPAMAIAVPSPDIETMGLNCASGYSPISVSSAVKK